MKWTYYYLYVLLDIYSRYVVGWMLAHRESADLARRLIQETIARQGVDPKTLTVHADNGPAPGSKLVAHFLADLGVTKTHSRPYTSTDNPYSEANFKILKYRPEFPDRFGSFEHGHSFASEFFGWYNHDHHHVGIGLMTPADVHFGRAPEILERRRAVLHAAFEAHPDRFVRKKPEPPRLPEAAWINPPRPRDREEKSIVAVH